MINRLYSDEIISLMKHFPAVAILGPRQCGKTTLARLFQKANPKKNTVYLDFEKGNLKYHSPQETSFLYETGNGELPCINKIQIDYFEKKLAVFPQMRTKNTKDGFYSKQIFKNE